MSFRYYVLRTCISFDLIVLLLQSRWWVKLARFPSSVMRKTKFSDPVFWILLKKRKSLLTSNVWELGSGTIWISLACWAEWLGVRFRVVPNSGAPILGFKTNILLVKLTIKTRIDVVGKRLALHKNILRPITPQFRHTPTSNFEEFCARCIHFFLQYSHFFFSTVSDTFHSIQKIF